MYKLNERQKYGLQDILLLKNNWDTYGGKAPTEETVMFAIEVIIRFPPDMQPELEPKPDGSVCLSWGENTFSICINHDY